MKSDPNCSVKIQTTIVASKFSLTCKGLCSIRGLVAPLIFEKSRYLVGHSGQPSGKVATNNNTCLKQQTFLSHDRIRGKLCHCMRRDWMFPKVRAPSCPFAYIYDAVSCMMFWPRFLSWPAASSHIVEFEPAIAICIVRSKNCFETWPDLPNC